MQPRGRHGGRQAAEPFFSHIAPTLPAGCWHWPPTHVALPEQEFEQEPQCWASLFRSTQEPSQGLPCVQPVAPPVPLEPLLVAVAPVELLLVAVVPPEPELVAVVPPALVPVCPALPPPPPHAGLRATQVSAKTKPTGPTRLFTRSFIRLLPRSCLLPQLPQHTMLGPHSEVVLHGQTSQKPPLQHWPPVQSALVVHTGHEVHAPPAQHWPCDEPAHSAFALQGQVPHWRVLVSQHAPAVQSALEVQHAWQVPPTQHWPAPPQSLSMQQVPAEQEPSAPQQLPAGQSPRFGAPVHWQAPHWREIGLQHWPPMQSPSVLQQTWQAPSTQQPLPPPQSESAQHAAG